MSLANSSKKQASSQHNGFVWAGAVARIKRTGGSARAGRRSALLSMRTASYANSSRVGRTAEPRSGGADRD
jgi:hypothetical protein